MNTMQNDTPGGIVVADPTKTVISTGSAGGHAGAYPHGPSWSAEPTFGQTAQAIHVANGDMHLLNSILTQFGFQGRETAYQGSESREAIRQEGRFVGKEISDGRREAATGFSRTDSLLEKGFGHTNEELAEAFGALNASSEKNFGQVVRDLQSVRGELGTLLVGGFKDGRFDAATNTAAIQLEAAKNAAAAALAAATNTAAIQASLAECCCEIKERIGADGQMTRDLINATTLQGVRDALQDSKNETAIAKILAGKVVG